MKMSPITMVAGGLLVLLGIGGYAYALTTPEPSWTALIPAFFGIVLVILGWLARQEKLRMHVMHGAVLVGLIGFIVPVGRLATTVTKEDYQFGFPSVSLILMTLICGVFVGLCVKSFIDARRQRKQEEAATTPEN